MCGQGVAGFVLIVCVISAKVRHTARSSVVGASTTGIISRLCSAFLVFRVRLPGILGYLSDLAMKKAIVSVKKVRISASKFTHWYLLMAYSAHDLFVR